LLLKDHGATNTQIAVIVSSIGAALNGLINPIVSYKSDRTRTRFGRRIPYLMVATPFLALMIALIPFAPEITGAALKVPALAWVLNIFPVAPVILMFGLLVVAFQSFNMVVGSIYYYLFRDVIPLDHLGRFLSSFRVVGTVASFVFNYWIFGTAATHSREIFCGIAALYAAGFLLMCWRVKEGGYAPVAALEKTTGGLTQAIRNFFVQSFGAPLYRWMFFTRSLVLGAFISAPFSLFFARDQLGIGLDQIGKITAWSSVICLPLAYPFGVLLDRWGSMRVLPLTLWAIILTNIACFLFIHDGRTLLVFASLNASAVFLFMIAQSVWLNRLFHHERIGQLSSANALVGSVFGMFLAPICGQFLGWVNDYRYIYIWTILLTTLALCSLVRTRSHWRKLGGHEHYQPPLPGAPLSAANAEAGYPE